MSHRVRGIRQGNDVVWLRILRQEGLRGLDCSPNVTLGLALDSRDHASPSGLP